MKVFIAGAGAVGCHYGIKLQQAGCEVTFLARGAHLAALQQGLRHQSEGVEYRFKVTATDQVSAVADADVVIFACKMHALKAMARAIAPYLSPQTLLVTLQNGVEASDWVAEIVPDHAVAAGTAFIGARIESPGYLIHSAAGGIHLAHWQQGEGSRFVGELVAAFKRASVAARLEADARLMLWRKLLWNTGFNAITAITRRYAKAMAEDEESAAIVLQSMRETVAVANAEGVALSDQDCVAQIEATLKMGPVKTSMWQDIEAVRKTEVDYLNGIVVRLGKKHAIDTSANQMLTALVHAIEP